ncbi:MAG: hypothetical protein R2710_12550 [Acidimicrobiales bacterium]
MAGAEPVCDPRPPRPALQSLYQIDMSSKNPRFRRKIWFNDQLPGLDDY